MSVPAPRWPRHGDGWWETVRYAIEDRARTLRLCLILLVAAIATCLAAVAAVLIHHVL